MNDCVKIGLRRKEEKKEKNILKQIKSDIRIPRRKNEEAKILNNSGFGFVNEIEKVTKERREYTTKKKSGFKRKCIVCDSAYNKNVFQHSKAPVRHLKRIFSSFFPFFQKEKELQLN